ncbi:hypothetical protein B0H17DRAFT_1209562 [Mycena rosella]|uniref:Uncharacterized protein n=1 Tax=Mycena rosella TaxID=1033263 RepID=A0AAD7G5J7_MYCRO|nr:hypothetical protein B0H17DRAFT_1209562 [Mycena rosella]
MRNRLTKNAVHFKHVRRREGTYGTGCIQSRTLRAIDAVRGWKTGRVATPPPQLARRNGGKLTTTRYLHGTPTRVGWGARSHMDACMHSSPPLARSSAASPVPLAVHISTPKHMPVARAPLVGCRLSAHRALIRIEYASRIHTLAPGSLARARRSGPASPCPQAKDTLPNRIPESVHDAYMNTFMRAAIHAERDASRATGLGLHPHSSVACLHPRHWRAAHLRPHALDILRGLLHTSTRDAQGLGRGHLPPTQRCAYPTDSDDRTTEDKRGARLRTAHKQLVRLTRGDTSAAWTPRVGRIQTDAAPHRWRG